MAIYNPGSKFRPTSSISNARRHPKTGKIQQHKGQDWTAPKGTVIPVAFDGKVIFNGKMTGFGNVVVVEHNINGKVVQTLYAHMQSKPDLSIGAKVNAGDAIGQVGSTGYSSGPHLHFEIKEDPTTPGKYDFSAPPQDPLKYHFPTTSFPGSEWMPPEIPDDAFVIPEPDFGEPFSDPPINNMDFHYFWVRDANGYEHRVSFFGTKQQFDQFYTNFGNDMIRDNSLENIKRWVDITKDPNDMDFDNIANDVDNDIDGDGISNAEDSQPLGFDMDGDGIPDLIDNDVDGDEIPNLEDYEPNGSDYDRDGVPDVMDVDDDGDFIPDNIDDENDARDFDLDGTPDYKDSDVDGDGIPNGIDKDATKFDPNIPKPLPPELPPAPPRDPLALDLNGDGIVNTLPMSRGIHFDLDNSGFAEQTSWVAPEDGLLVLDRNNNNFIDGGAELFGTETLLSSGEYAAHGFEALAEFDANRDGVIDSGDAIYSSVRVWRDANSNGLADSGELKSLGELNIKSIGTAYSNTRARDANNVEHREAGLFTYNNSTQGISNTLWFESDRRITKPVTELQGNITIPETIKKLPDAVGFGNTYSLHHAMTVDASGELQKKVQRFSVELDPDKRKLLLREILVMWTKTGDVVAGSRGARIDATSLAIMESFWGQPALQNKPFGEYADSINKAYGQLEQSVYAQLMVGSHMRDLISLTDFSLVDGEWTADYSVVVDLLVDDFLAGNELAQFDLIEFMATIRGINPYSDVLHNSLVEHIQRVADLLPVQPRIQILSIIHSVKEQVIGTDNVDLLHGSGGDDALNGGRGDDTLSGREGNDTYIYNLGDGNDTIIESTGADVLRFGAGITAESIIVAREGSSLIIKHNGSNIKLLNVTDYWAGEVNPNNIIERIEFDDGEVWDFEQLKKLAGRGSKLNDNISGFSTADVITGDDGDDALDGWGGDDVLIGGSDYDKLSGGDGNDTYVFNIGDGIDVISDSSGVDTIRFGAGITPDDVWIARRSPAGAEITSQETENAAGTDWVFVLKSGNEITVSNAGLNANNAIEKVEFANGDVWDPEKIAQRIQYTLDQTNVLFGSNQKFEQLGYYGFPELDTTFIGIGGNDQLIGGIGNDTFIGGNGINVMSGGAGNDTYVIHSNNMKEQVVKSFRDSGDRIFFADGISPGEVRVRILHDTLSDLFLDERGFHGYSGGPAPTNLTFSTDDGFLLTVENIFQDHRIKTYQIFADGATLIDGSKTSGSVEFLDGTRWDYASLIQMALQGSDTTDRIVGTINNDEVHGLKGDDYIQTFNGDDLLHGGEGDDALYGGGANDTYLYSLGDGSDTIYDDHGVDAIKFGEGIVKEDLIFTSRNDGWTMEVGFKNSSDKITIHNWVKVDSSTWGGLSGYRGGIIEHFMFANGDLLNLDVNYLPQHLVGTDGNDHLEGGHGDDTLEGLGGFDMLDGEGGNDTYVFGHRSAGAWITEDSGSEQDTIYLEDISSDQSDKVIIYFGKDFYLNIAINYPDTTSLITIPMGYNASDIERSLDFNSRPSFIENLRFSDGVVWDAEKIMAETRKNSPGKGVVLGTDANDVLEGFDASELLYAGMGDDYLLGGVGDDQLDGGWGNDIYRYEAGHGHDVIIDWLGNDILDLVNIKPEDVVVSQSGFDIVIKFLESSNDSIMLADSFSAPDFSAVQTSSIIETIRFQGGVEWNADILVNKAKTPQASFNTQANKISGSVPNASVTVVMRDSNGIELARVNPTYSSSGYKFSFVIDNALYSNKDISIVALDESGNESPALTLKVPDKTPPAMPVAAIDSMGTIVSGTSEPGSVVQVKRSSTVLGEAVSDASGSFSVTLSSAQINKQTLSVTAKDVAGNISAIKSIIAPDKTPPGSPTAAFDTAGKIITGKAEAGSVVEVRNKEGVLLKKVTADVSTGAYSITLLNALTNKELVNVTATDNAGNISTARAIYAPDTTPPAAPSASLDSTRKIIIGVAEMGSKVEVKNSGGTLLKTVTANATTGNYTVTLTTALAIGDTVSITAKDAASNISPATVLKAAAAQAVAALFTSPEYLLGEAVQEGMVIGSESFADIGMDKYHQSNDALIQAIASFTAVGGVDSRKSIHYYEERPLILAAAS